MGFWSELLLPEHLLFQRLRLMPKLTHGAFMVDMVDTMVDIEDMDTLDTIDHMVDMDSMDMARDLLNQLPNPLLMLKPMLMLGTEDTDMVDTHTTVDTDMEDMLQTIRILRIRLLGLNNCSKFHSKCS